MEFNNKIIYVGDPMCSWCWGISNDFEKLIKYYQDDFPPIMLMGGLSPGNTEPMDQKTKDFIRHHWDEVHKRTKQPFNYDILNEDVEFIYDTEIPSRVVIIYRELYPETTFEFFKAVQKAFYVENKDTNKIDTYLEILEKFPHDIPDFKTKFHDETYKKKAYHDFGIASNMGITGFPTVVLGFNNQLFALAIGYCSFEKMKERLESITANQSV